jgi:predicted nucleotidyltransferase
MNEFPNTNHILALLSVHREQLASFGVEQIGIAGPCTKAITSNDEDTDLVVNLQLDKRNFSNFMSLVSYLEKILSCNVNLSIHHPVKTCLSQNVLNTVEYVSSAG